MKVVIIGAGPAGLAAADHLQQQGHQVVVFEKGPIAAAIAHYPPYMTYFSTAPLLEIGGMPLTIPGDKPTRREYLYYLTRFVQDRHIDVRTYHLVSSIKGQKGCFTVCGETASGEEFSETAERLVVASGASGEPRRLEVPGENLPKVRYRYTEPHPYVGQKVLVVGGRNSAVESALELWRHGAQVTLSYRRDSFPDSVKYWLKPDIENRIQAGEIQAYMPSRVISIEPRSVHLSCNGKEIMLPNDFVLAQTGYQPDVAFLQSMGLEVDPVSQRPSINPQTYESNVPGIFIAGVIQAGNISSEIFIENSRHHGLVIAQALAAETRSASLAP